MQAGFPRQSSRLSSWRSLSSSSASLAFLAHLEAHSPGLPSRSFSSWLRVVSTPVTLSAVILHWLRATTATAQRIARTIRGAFGRVCVERVAMFMDVSPLGARPMSTLPCDETVRFVHSFARGMGRGVSQRVGPAQAHGRVAKAEQRDTGPDPQPRFVPHEGVDLFRIVLEHGFRCVPLPNRDGPKRPL